jgi:hypothetical protein
LSRNLAASGCCGVTVQLADIRGKPIEFRRYYEEAPRLGTKWTCPHCRTDYFVIWHRFENFTGRGGMGDSRFTLDLSYYGSYNDERGDPLMSGERPRHLCEDNAEDVYWHWGFVGEGA